MQYLTPTLTREVIGRLQTFENELVGVFNKYGYNLRDNLGRRNQLVSQAQEKEVARSLRKIYDKVIEDGAPGKPDIYIVDIDKELECKLSSGTGKNKTKSFCLQTDWATLKKKGKLDYLYILTTPDFSGFCVLFFRELTIDDFHPPASGSRGKARMNKSKAMKKCEVLHGRIVNINNITKMKYKLRRDVLEIQRTARFAELRERLRLTSKNAKIKRKQILNTIRSEIKRFRKSIKKWDDKIKMWEQKEDSYSFKFEPIL
tara:strand:- start:2557 stop:3333 length:777 start_codon:yes stop_codon:yes gene_type:complete